MSRQEGFLGQTLQPASGRSLPALGRWEAGSTLFTSSGIFSTTVLQVSHFCPSPTGHLGHAGVEAWVAHLSDSGLETWALGRGGGGTDSSPPRGTISTKAMA